MRPTLSLIRREFGAYFLSPIAYVVMAVFLAVMGYRFYLTLEQLTATGPRGVIYPMQFMIEDRLFWLVFLFIPPLLTMRLFAEERNSGTLEMLLTAPLRDWQIVFAKFIACFGFYVLMWVPTLVYLPILTDWYWWTPYCRIDPYPVIATYAGLALVGAMFLALGLFISSLVKSQLLAAILSLFVGLLFIVPGMWQPDLDPGSVLARSLSYVTVPLHFERNFSRGIIDTRQLVLYGSVALLCLFLTVRSLESRRWR